MKLSTVEQTLEDLRAGSSVIVVDDEDPASGGDLVMAASEATPERLNLMARYAGSLVHLAMTGERLDELRIPLMVPESGQSLETAFCVSVAGRGLRRGSAAAADRARTIGLLLDPSTRPDDLVRPGHVHPIRARRGGVLVRAGHTEAAVDLARLAGLAPAGALCEILNERGEAAAMAELEGLAERHGLRMVSMAQIIEYRCRHEKLVARGAEARLPTKYGDFAALAYTNALNNEQDVALVMGDVRSRKQPVAVRVHSECLTGDVFGSQRCDCGEQLQRALQMIAAEGCGVLLYMRQEGRGIGLHNKLRAYELQDQGLDTVEANLSLGFPADLRDYGLGAQILVDLGLKEIRLLTNNPRKVVGLEGYGLKVVERVPLLVDPNPSNYRYLATKQQKLGHLLTMEEVTGDDGENV